MALLALFLNACGDHAEEGVTKENQNKHDAEKRPAKLAQNSDSKQILKLPQIMADDQSTSEEDDQMVDIEELERYRQSYAEAEGAEEKAEALIALVQADEQNAVALLQEAYASPEPLLRKEAVLQMQDFVENEQVVDMLLNALDDPDPDVVVDAIEGLSAIDSKRVLEALTKIAQTHPDETVRESARDYVDQEQEDEE